MDRRWERGPNIPSLPPPSSVKSHFRCPEALGSHALGPSGGYSRIENDIRTDKKGRDTRLKGTRSVSANVNFHLDDSISPSPPSVHPERRKKILVSRARQWFPARFLGNRTFGTFVIDGFRENAISSLLWGRLKRWDVYENPWIRKRMRESCFHSWFLLILIVNLSIYILRIEWRNWSLMIIMYTVFFVLLIRWHLQFRM